MSIDFPDLERFDNVKYEEATLVEWFCDDPRVKTLKLKDGYIELRYDKATNQLLTVVEYNSDRELSGEELRRLAEYTRGQITDGVGESFAQELADKHGMLCELAESSDSIHMAVTP